MFIPLPGFLVQGTWVLGMVVVWMCVMLALIMFHKQKARSAVPPTKWGVKLRVLVDDLHLMGQSPYLYWALAASLPYLLLQVVPIYSLMQGYGMGLSLGPAMVLLVVLRLGTLVPQAPGNVGAFQAVTVMALGWFNIEKTTAAGFSVMIWAVITLPLLVAGFVALAVTGLKFNELKQQLQQAGGPASDLEEAGPR